MNNQTTTLIPDTPLRRSLAIQARVIGALLVREMLTRFGRHNIGFMWLFVEPMLFTLGITALWTATKGAHGSSLPIVAFAVTGYSSVLMWRNSAGRCAKAIEPNLSLMYHRNVKVIDIFAARIILEMAGSTTSILILSTVFIALGWMAMPNDILMMIQAWLLLAGFAVGLGLVIGAVSERSEVFERVWHTVTYLMFPMSGAVFMVEWLPSAAQKVVLSLPMVHGVEMLRHGYYGNMVRTYEEPFYLLTCDLVLLMIGLALVRETGRRVEPE